MHFVVSWDIHAQGAKWTEVNNQLQACLAPYSWVKPLNTLYVVQVASQVAGDHIVSMLTRTAQSAAVTGVSVHFLATPLMSGGRYQGFLSQEAWNAVNERSV